MPRIAVRGLLCNNFLRRIGVRALLALALAISSPPCVRAGSLPAPDSIAGDPRQAPRTAPGDLAATSAVPWNPAHPLPSRQPWERTLLLPGQIVTLPLSGAGYLMRRGLLTYEQNTPGFGGKQAKRTAPSWAAMAELPGLGNRTGLGLAAELRAPLLAGTFASRMSARYAGTVNGYNSTLLGVVGRPLGLQYGYDWRPREQFYGIGRSAAPESLSGYAMQREFVRGTLRWSWDRDRGLIPPASVISLWGGPRSLVTRTGREAGRVSYDRRFPAMGAATLDLRVENLVYGASFSRDRRSGHPHWSHGERVLLSAERYDAPIQALALHDGHSRGAQFTRYGFETEMGLSFMRDPRSVRLLLKGIDQNVSSGGDRMLLSDLATLGGNEGLMGFEPGRFHDRDLMLAKLTYLFPILRGVEVDLHSEWGAVYHDVWNDAKPNTLRSSAGFAVRLRSALKPHASAGLDFSHESVRLRLTLGGME